MASASAAERPRICWTTSCALRSDMRTPRADALTCIAGPPLPRSGAALALAVTAEVAGGSELAQLVADHVLRHVDRHVAAAVVDADGVTHHLREDRRVAAPGLEHALVARPIHDLDA